MWLKNTKRETRAAEWKMSGRCLSRLPKRRDWMDERAYVRVYVIKYVHKCFSICVFVYRLVNDFENTSQLSGLRKEKYGTIK
jgi:hypothetical protein